MKRLLLVLLVLVGFVALTGTAFALAPGATVEERCVNAAKAYIKKHNIKNPELNAMQISLFRHSHPKYDKQWEELTGCKINATVYGYTDIPSKIMAEAVAKTVADVTMHAIQYCCFGDGSYPEKTFLDYEAVESAPEKCEFCNRTIRDSETPYVIKEHVVCRQCYESIQKEKQKHNHV